MTEKEPSQIRAFSTNIPIRWSVAYVRREDIRPIDRIINSVSMKVDRRTWEIMHGCDYHGNIVLPEDVVAVPIMFLARKFYFRT